MIDKKQLEEAIENYRYIDSKDDDELKHLIVLINLAHQVLSEQTYESAKEER